MKTAANIWMALGIPFLCAASTPDPYAGYCALLDRAVAAARFQPRQRATALDLMERVAGGQVASIRGESEAAVGLAPGELRKSGFDIPPLRECALRKIGETALPEAVAYLSSLKSSNFATDTTQRIWPAAQIALRDARLRMIANEPTKVEFLKSVLAEHHDAVSGSAVASWAVDELCDRGAQSALTEIERSIRSRLSGRDGEEEFHYCEARINVILHNPDRVLALGSLLTLDKSLRSPRLTMWAIHQLASDHSPQADAEMERFALEIRKVPDGTPARDQLFLFDVEIRGVQQAKAAVQ